MTTATAPKLDSSGNSIADLCEAHDLLTLRDGMIRVPFLIRGRLVAPPVVTREQIDAAFAERGRSRGPSAGAVTWAKVGDAQVLRLGGVHDAVMPLLRAEDVIERDAAALADDLYNIPFSEVQAFVRSLRRALEESSGLVDSIRETTLDSADMPAVWHNSGFAALHQILDADALAEGVDEELRVGDVAGREVLDRWVDLDPNVIPAPVNLLATGLFTGDEYAWSSTRPAVRAMPTRQLHITAGNAPHIPLISAVRAIATKSPAVVKSPAGAVLPGALLALAALAGAPDHPLTRHFSIVYWKGGDEEIETRLFMPGSFDRIVVWGAPDAVVSVKQRAIGTKVLSFNPRYGLSLIGRDALRGDDASVRTLAIRGVSDSLIANQKACIASQVHYVEGDEADVRRYAEACKTVLADFDEAAPNVLPDFVVGEIKRLRRGRFLDAEWLINERDGFYTSGVVIARDSFPISCHPMCRMVVIRPVDDLADVVPLLHAGVATVGVAPETRRLELRDSIAAAGVSNIVPLAQSGRGWPSMTHDGMRVLAELVDWKNG